jgi:hypothetical protein
MKHIFTFFVLFVLGSCAKTTNQEPTLSASDAAAVAGMAEQSAHLEAVIKNLIHASSPAQRHHWDSLFRYHDALFWSYHHQYNHDNGHPHHDHSHHWVPYDPTLDHRHHYHPAYPQHAQDSLVVVPNGHHPSAGVHPQAVQSLEDHHRIDSLHHLHQKHHL